MRKLGSLVVVVLVSCAEPVAPPPSFAHDAATADLEVLFGPVTVTRARGAGVTTRTEIVSTAGFEKPFVLVATGGRAMGSVTLDGVEVVSPADLRGGGTVSVPVDVLDGSVVELTIAGRPGATLTVTIEGRRAPVLFCPGRPGAFDDLQAAADATPAGGTLLICDGTWPMDSIAVGHAMTVTAEHPGLAALDVSGRGFRIDSVGTGTFVIRDLRFSGRGDVVRALGTVWSSVLAERNVFDMVDPSIAINTQTGAPGALVTIRDNVMRGGITSAFIVTGSTAASGPLGIVENNFIAGQSFSNLQIQGLASAVVTNNTFEACGEGGCIRVPGAGPVVVRGNTMRTDAAHVSRAAVAFFDRPGSTAASMTILDNLIEGVAPADPNVPDDYGFNVAAFELQLLEATTTVSMARNLATNAWTGIRLTTFENFGSGPVTARDNVFAGTGIGLFLAHRASGPVDIHRNDFTPALVTDIWSTGLSPADGSLTCNWWGSDTGPAAVVGVAAPVYTPFATQPIANDPDVVCP